MRVITLAAFAASLVAASSVTAAPFSTSNQSLSNARSASIESFQEHAELKKCKSEPCELEFPAVKNNTQILIQHVSCNFGLDLKTTLIYVALGDEDSDFDMLPSNKISAPNLVANFYTVSAQAYFFVNSGQKPEVSVLADGKKPEGLTCTISGQLVPAEITH